MRMKPLTDKSGEVLELTREDMAVLLAGGDKRTQDRDIKKALKLAQESPFS